MKKVILVFLVLITCSNCSASSIDDYKKAKAQHDNIMIQASVLEVKYLNLPKESIIDELGKPSKIIKEKWPYFLDQSCRKDGCPLENSDEVWIYQFTDSSKGGVHSYQIGIYIKEDKIVRIGG